MSSMHEYQKLAVTHLKTLPFAGYSGPRVRADLCCAIYGGTMTSGDPTETGHIRLSDDDVAYLMNVLRNCPSGVRGLISDWTVCVPPVIDMRASGWVGLGEVGKGWVG